MARRNRNPAPAPAIAQEEAPATTAPATTPEVDEITEQENTTTPPPTDQPTRTVGTSNLATTIRAHRHRYVPALAPSGKKTANNGDRVARILLHTPLPALSAFVLEHFAKRYDHLNTGHERMCCGNLVRAAAQKGDAAVLEFLAKHEPKVEAPAEAEEA